MEIIAFVLAVLVGCIAGAVVNHFYEPLWLALTAALIAAFATYLVLAE